MIGTTKDEMFGDCVVDESAGAAGPALLPLPLLLLPLPLPFGRNELANKSALSWAEVGSVGVTPARSCCSMDKRRSDGDGVGRGSTKLCKVETTSMQNG